MSELKVIKANPDQYRLSIKDEHLNFNGSIFYHPEFLNLAAETLDLVFEPLICYRGEEIVGLANILKGGKFSIRAAMIPRLFQYFGPIALSRDENISEALIKAIRQDIDLAVFCLPPEQIDLSGFNDWKKIQRLTYYFSPDIFENMKNRCSAKSKNKLNRAFRANVEIKPVTEFPYYIYEASFRRHRLYPPVGQSQLTSWVEQLMRLNLAFTLIALVNDKPVAVKTVLFYGEYSYAWVAGSLPEYNHMGINQLIALKAGEYLYDKGITRMDLLGGDIESIAQYKRSLGSIPQTHFQFEKGFSLKGQLYRKLMKLKGHFHA